MGPMPETPVAAATDEVRVRRSSRLDRWRRAGQQECARFVADRKLPLKRLLTHRFRLEQADEAYRLFDTQTTGKGAFMF